MRWKIALALLFLGLSGSSQGFYRGGFGTGPIGWQQIPIGPGGYVSNISNECDQGVGACNNTGTTTAVERNDTYGAYYRDPTKSCGNTPQPFCWTQIVTSNSMPSADVTASTAANGGGGAYEIVIAPSNTQHFYLFFNNGKIYSSTNRGATWTACAGWTPVTANGADASKGMGNFMAVDPANEANLLVGTPAGGAFYSTNSCSTFTHITAVPNSSAAGGGYGNTLVAFDRNTISGGSTSRACATSYSNGIYCTTTGLGGTWAALNTANMPTTFWKMNIDVAGNLYLIDNTGGGGGKFWSYNLGTTTWSQVSSGTIGSNAVAFAVDPNNVNHIVVMQKSSQGLMFNTTTGPGGTWLTQPTHSQVATDVPWLQFTTDSFMSVGNIAFDTAGGNLLDFAEGSGVWTTSPPSTTGQNIVWTSISAGIEELDMTWIISPPSGTPVVFAQDRPEFYLGNLTQYPSIHGLANPQCGTCEIIYGYSGDWSTASPSTIVGMGTNPNNPFTPDESGISTDGGQTFTKFGSVAYSTASSQKGGCMAATSASNLLWVPTGNAGPFHSTDGGATWAATLASVTQGWPNSNQATIQICAADRVNANTMYLYNFFNGTQDEVYTTSNCGTTCTWTAQGSPAFKSNGTGLTSSNQAQLVASPLEAGVLAFTAGHSLCCTTHPISQPFYVSTNAGVSFTTITGMQDVWAVGWGKNASGSSHAALYVWGWLSGVLGTYRSNDNGSTWTQLDNGYPLGIFAPITTLTGDTNTYGQVYECFNPGCVHAQFN